jgi:hypothetical protein
VTVVAERSTTDRAQQLEREILQGCAQIRVAWIQLAGRLYEFQQGRMWEALGYEWFKDFLARPGIELSPSYARLLIRSWRELVVNQGVAPQALAKVDQWKVRYVIGAVKAGEVELEEALEDCHELSRQEVSLKYRKHGYWDGSYKVCPTCGARRRQAA